MAGTARDWVSPLPPRSLESSSYHDFPGKIRISKSLGIKIRETKELCPDFFSDSAALCGLAVLHLLGQ